MDILLIENIGYIIAIICVGVFAISLNYFLTNREQDISNREERLIWLNEQATRTIEAMKALKEASCKPEIIEKLNQHVTLQIEEISTLAPDSDIMNQINKKKEITDNTAPSDIHLHNDRELKRIQIYITYTERLFLYWLNIRNVVDAHRTQAKRVMGSADNLTALSHLKHAKAILFRAHVSQSLKQERLDDIQRMVLEIEPLKEKHNDSLDEELDNFY